MASVCSRYNARSDWLILGHYSPVMPTGRLRACKIKAKSHIINNLLTSNVRSLRENLKPRPCRIDLAIREFKQIATAGTNTAAGSTFPQKWDTAHVRRLDPTVAWNLTTWVGMFCSSGYYVGFISLLWPFSTEISAFYEFHWILYPLKSV